MTTWKRVLPFTALIAMLAPAAAHAQSAISGTVKDATGAVLPGVTVEAASPVLIEKAKTVAPSAVHSACDLPRRPPQVFVQEAEGTIAVDGVPAVEIFDFGALAQSEVVVKTADLRVLVSHPGVFAHAVVVPALHHERARNHQRG